MTTLDSSETNRLLEHAAAGQRDGFDHLLARHREYLRQVISQRLDPRLQPRIDLSDVIQETEIDAFQQIDDYLNGRPMPFRIWLRKLAQQRLIKLWKRHVEAGKRSLEREEPLPDQSSLQLARLLKTAGMTPIEKVVNREIARTVRRSLAQLPELDREILLMRYIENLSNHEIGYIVDLRPNTVSKRHVRALLKLERILRETGLGEDD